MKLSSNGNALPIFRNLSNARDVIMRVPSKNVGFQEMFCSFQEDKMHSLSSPIQAFKQAVASNGDGIRPLFA